MTASLDRLFRPKSVALVGASSDPKKIGGRPLHFLRHHGFDGDIWPVNPRSPDIDGLRCYPDIAALPGAPDVAMILIGPAHAETAVRDLAARGTGAAVVLAGGFAEVGDEGAARQAALIDAAGNMRLLGPNTIGMLNMTDGITLSASGALDTEDRFRGSVAIVSQSGGILGSLLSRAAARGIGLSHLVATGNEADVEVADLVDWLADDPATDVIALYLETLRDPDYFRAAAQKAAANGKRLVVFKVGRSEAGARSAASHTGALAGEDRFFGAFFEQLGVIRVDRYNDLLDVSMGLSTGRSMAGTRLAILTTTGGAAGLVADACGLEGFDTPAPGPETTAALAALLKDDGYRPDRNPVDLTLAGLKPEILHGAITALLDSPDFDAVIPVIGSSAVGRPTLAADPIAQAFETATKPVLAYTSPNAPAIVQRLNHAGVPAYETPEACAAVLSALARKSPAGRGQPASPAEVPPAEMPSETAGLTGALNEAEAKAVFGAFGIAGVRERIAASPEAAAALASDFGGPVVVKLLARAVIHKTEIGGVRLGVPPEKIGDVCGEIAAAAKAAGVGTTEGFLVQEMVSGGVEMILGFARDPQLGPAILLGAGGTLAELYGDTAIRLLPLSRGDAEAMLDALRITTVLNGYRGAPPSDRAALIDTVLAFAEMCAALGDRLIDAEINPLFVLPVEQGAGQETGQYTKRGIVAADGVMILSD